MWTVTTLWPRSIHGPGSNSSTCWPDTLTSSIPYAFLIALFFSKSRIPFADAEITAGGRSPTVLALAKRYVVGCIRKLRAHMTDAALQLLGIMGLIQTIPPHLGMVMFRGKTQRAEQAPLSRIPMRGADGGPASHALPGTVMSNTSHIHVPLKVLEEPPRSDAA